MMYTYEQEIQFEEIGNIFVELQQAGSGGFNRQQIENKLAEANIAELKKKEEDGGALNMKE